jgi:site-specific recombinase XerD
VSGTKDKRRVREALKTRDWNKAQEVVRKWDVDGERPKTKVRATIEEWRDQFIHDAEARHLSNGTMRLYKLLFRQLIQFTTDRGIKFANDLDLAALTDFRAGWKIGALTAAKKLERLRSIFKFALQRKMVEENYAAGLVGPKVKHNPTLPFSKEEMTRILKAAESTDVDKRVKAFILTMRHSGLRISDVATLAVESLKGNRLKLYQAKTGEPVSVLLPKPVADALNATRPSNPQHFFWTGESRLETVTGFWRERIADVLNLAKVSGHPHRFRDTFAVALLEGGASIETVSILLGHSSIRVTEKHYNPWVKTRQDALDKAVLSATRQ